MTKVVAIVPAHNEADQIAQTLLSLKRQSVAPDRMVVAADNCSDLTADIARSFNGVEVVETVDNQHKKAGALNQALSQVLPTLDADDLVLVMDADTVLAPDFVKTAREVIASDNEIGAVGGIFYGDSPSGFLELAQSNEYVRYARELKRTGRVMVLTGTATIFRVKALDQIPASRGIDLPGNPGDVYDRDALTEDMEITVALKSLGWKLESPEECMTRTELMPTFSALHKQRVRWYRGAIENLREYGVTKVTARYWGQQVMIAIGTVLMSLCIVLMVLDAAFGLIAFNPLWASVGLIFWLERVVTAWKAGRRGKLLAALYVPEIFYDLILQRAFVVALWSSLSNREAAWHHHNNPTERYSISHV